MSLDDVTGQHLSASYLKLKADCDLLERAYADLRHRNDDLERELADSQSAAAVVRAQLAQLQHDHHALQAKQDELIATIANKHHTIEKLLRRLYGNSREHFVPGQELIAAVAGLIEAAHDPAMEPDESLVVAEDGAAEGTSDAGQGGSPAGDNALKTGSAATTNEGGGSRHRRPPGGGGRRPLPADLPRVEQAYAAPADHPDLAGVSAVRELRTTVIERLHVAPITWQVLRITCPVVEVTKGGRTMQVTLTPPEVVPRGQISDQALVHIVIDKHADHLPYYRQEKRAGRCNLDLGREKLCRWEQRLATFLKPVYDAQLAALMEEPCLGIDDTVMRRWDLGRGTGRCAQGRLWAVSGDAGWYYLATDTREGKWISGLLEPYSGAIMGDGCSSHHQLLRRDDILSLFCWAHVRRMFFESAAGRRREEALAVIQRLYQVEAGLERGPPEQILFQRRHASRPILEVFKSRLDDWLLDPAVTPASDFGKAVRYAHKRWEGLVRYAGLPAAPIDNNRTEQGMRPNALMRKNALFHASEAGSRAYAILQTLIQSAWKLGLDPEAYLNGIVAARHDGVAPETCIPLRWQGMPERAASRHACPQRA